VSTAAAHSGPFSRTSRGIISLNHHGNQCKDQERRRLRDAQLRRACGLALRQNAPGRGGEHHEISWSHLRRGERYRRFARYSVTGVIEQRIKRRGAPDLFPCFQHTAGWSMSGKPFHNLCVQMLAGADQIDHREELNAFALQEATFLGTGRSNSPRSWSLFDSKSP
jgi:hypothetical protein